MLNYKKQEGGIDWELVSKEAGVDFSDKIFPVKNYLLSIPEIQYDDVAEVDRILGDDRKYLYTFVQAEQSEETKKRNDICVALIELSKKGNIAAEKELIKNISFLVDVWSDRIPDFKIYRYYKEEKYKIIRRCIYNYENFGSFIGYLYKVLKKASRGLQPIKDVEYN